MNCSSSLYELYLKLMDANDQGKYVWEKIRDKQLTAAPCFAGKLYEKSDTRLMVVGRAVNGWEIAFGECNDPASTTVSILNQQFSFADIVNPEGIPYPEEPEKRNYQYYSSNFWRLAKFVLEEYEESEPTTPLSNTWYTDKLCWNERVVWSNLYKVAPRKGNNPEWAFIKPQMQVYIDIMKEEIELYSPKRVLFITNSDYFAPWKRQPSFAKEFGVELNPGASGAVVGAGIYFDTKMIVCKRPDVFGMSHQEIATMAKEIKTAFEAL